MFSLSGLTTVAEPQTISILAGDCSELARSHNPHNLIDASFGGISRNKPDGFAVTGYQNGVADLSITPRRVEIS